MALHVAAVPVRTSEPQTSSATGQVSGQEPSPLAIAESQVSPTSTAPLPQLGEPLLDPLFCPLLLLLLMTRPRFFGSSPQAESTKIKSKPKIQNSRVFIILAKIIRCNWGAL